MNVRRPEWDEQPSRPTTWYARANHTTMLSGVIGPPRSEVTTGPTPAVMARQAINAVRKSGWIGIRRPLRFLAARSRSSMAVPIVPVGSTTMSHVRLAISPARSPAFADSSTTNRLRMGLRVVEA